MTKRRRPDDADAPPSIASLTGWTSAKARKRGLLLVLTAAGILAWLAWVVDVRALGRAFANLESSHLVLAGLITACLPLIVSLRLRLILGAGGLIVGWRRAACVVLGIHPLSVISPARLGEGFRIVALRNLADSATLAGLVVGERLLDIAVLALLASGAGLVGGRAELTVIALVVLGGIVGVLALAALHDRIPLPARLAAPAARLAGGLLALRRSPPHLLGAVLLTMGHWSLTMGLVSVLFAGVGAPLPIVTIATVMPLAIFAGLLPVTLGGFGTREAALVALLAGQAAAPDALAAGLLYSLCTYVLLGAAGLPFTRRALCY